MTDVAALGLSVDSDGVVKGTAALDAFAASSDKASAASEKASKSTKKSTDETRSNASAQSSATKAAMDAAAAFSRLDIAITAYANAQAQAKVEMDAHKAALNASRISLEQYNKEALRTKAALGVIKAEFASANTAFLKSQTSVAAVGKTFKFTASEGLNFSRQMADIGVTAAMGMSPLMIALQQGPQLFEILQTAGMRAGTGIGASFKAAGVAIWTAMAPILPIIASVAAAAGTIAAGFAMGARSINKDNSDIIAGLHLTEKQLERVKESGVSTAVTIGDTFFAFFDVIGDRLQSAFEGPLKWLADAWNATMDFITKYGAESIKLLMGFWGGMIGYVKAAWATLPGAIADIFTQIINGAIAGLEKLVNAHISAFNTLIDGANSIFGTSFERFSDATFKRVENKFAGQGASAGAAIAQGVVDGAKAGYAAGGKFLDDVSKAAVARREKAILDAAGKADVEKTPSSRTGRTPTAASIKPIIDKNIEGYNEMTAAIDAQIKATEQANATIGMYGKSLYQYTALQELMNDADKRGIKLTNEQKKALAEKALALGEVKAQGDVLRFMEEFNESTEAATRAMTTERGEIGMTGAALYAYRYEQEALNKAIDQHIQLSPEQLAAINSAAKAYGEGRAAIDEQKTAAEGMNDQLRDMISLLQGIGGMGNVFGGLLGGLMTGDFKGLGAIGSLANIFTKKGGLDDYAKQGDAIAGKISEVFKVGGDFANTISSALQGAGTGAVAGAAILGKQGTAGQLGGMAGGALGQIGGEALSGMLGKLGAAAGPIGAIVGGVLGTALGGIVGGLMKKTKWARADISSATGDPNFRSNSGKYEGAVSGAADGVIKGLNSIAEQLGGVSGEFASIAIGIRDGNYRVNANGTSLKVKNGAKDFGEDSAAAIAYAIQQAIQKGAITGINASVMNLLQASGDFEEQLNKASQLQSLFAEIAQSADPLGFEIDQLAKKFASARALLAEANATPEEIAQVDAYQQQQEAAIRARYAAEAAAKRAQTLEKESELLALQGKMTQSLAKAREAELSQMDASLVALQKQIYLEQDAAERRSLQIQLLEAEGNAYAALQLSRAEVMRATTNENKALQQQIFLKSDLSAAYARERDELTATSEKMKGFTDTLRTFRDSIYGGDQSQLSYAQALAKMIQTGSLAATGDETALGNLPGVGRDYLDIAKSNSRSALEYQRAQALVAGYTDQALGYTTTAQSNADMQLDALKQSVGSLITIEETTLTVAEILQRIADQQSAQDYTTTQQDEAIKTNTSNNKDMQRSFRKIERELERMGYTNDQIVRIWQNMTSDGTSLKISTWSDDPLKTTGA